MTFASMFRPFLIGAFSCGVALSSGCANYLAPFETEPARLGSQTARTSDLRALPAPKEPIVAAVYRFRDQTGQYKPTATGSSFSTAVTQGATSVLIGALEESGWFVPIEREALSNLLNERQIIQTTRAQRSDPDELTPLPPLLFAGILIEGGIIGFDTNVRTGGVGARYLGMGASGQYRQDQVTVYLRAVSTQSGRVLKTVHATKMIGSQQVDASVFRYVDLDRILEAEAGYTFNEPKLVAVREAIEEAVIALVVEGLRDDLWSVADEGDLDHPAILAYERRTSDAARRDAFGLVQSEPRPPLGLTVTAGVQRADGDVAHPLLRPSVTAEAHYALTDRLGAGVTLTWGEVAARDAYERTQLGLGASLRYANLPERGVSPFLAAGGSLLYLDDGAAGDRVRAVRRDEGRRFVPAVSGSVGVQAMLTRQVGLIAAFTYTYALDDVLDAVSHGDFNDSLWGVRTGVTYYLPGF